MDVQHALTTLACTLHLTAEIPDIAGGTIRLTTIGNVTTAKRIMERNRDPFGDRPYRSFVFVLNARGFDLDDPI